MITRIRDVRKAKGLTLDQVGRRCNPATTAQTAATTTPDQACPIHWAMPHHAAMDKNSSTIWTATPAPESMPTPAPARVADSRTSAFASSTS